MQLQITASTLALQTREPLNAAGRSQPAVLSAVLPSSQTSSETLQNSPVLKPVEPASSGDSIDSYTEEQQLNRYSQPEQKSSTVIDPQSEEQQLIRELASRDQEVRQHELSHAAAGGKYAGAPSFEYQRGPDGRLYAVGGEVSIDTSPIPNDPEATLEKAEVLIRAALSVADPSPQDRAIAARAAAMAAEARAELAQQNRATEDGNGNKREDDKLREDRRSEALQNQIKEQQEQNDTQSERLQDYNEQLVAVNEKLAEINQRLIDAGVFKKLFSEGFIFDEIV